MKRLLCSNAWITVPCLAIASVAGSALFLTVWSSNNSNPAPQTQEIVSASIASENSVENTDSNLLAATTVIPNSTLTPSSSTPLINGQPGILNEREALHVAQRFNCDDPQYQQEMNYCAGLDYERADDELNRTYTDLLSVIPESRREKLIAAELAWITYRDNTCEFERSQFDGGSIEPLIYYSCMARLTQDQTLQLETYLEEYQ
ncbi:MAG: lysozyme inhibitor LprI family protein [Cyanobacteria bacterium P01_E01_bin.6]